MPKILALIQSLIRTDDAGESINYEFFAIVSEFEKWADSFKLDMRLTKLAEQTRDMSVRQWKKICSRTLGIDILEDYYKGEFYREAITEWVHNNVKLIKSAQNQSLMKIQDIVVEGRQHGRLIRDIQQDIYDETDATMNQARLIARDQTGRLNANITQSQQADAGVNEYIWSTVQDELVRVCHAELNGRRFSWSDPPEQWYRLKNGKKVYTGKRANPGEAYQCRCVALPVFDIDTLNLVFEKVDNSKNIT